MMTEIEQRTVCVDLDFTLCTHEGNYETARPIPGASGSLRRLRRDGWFVVIATARHFNHWKLTVDWLDAHRFEYDQIVFGKTPARVYVDDRAVAFGGDWGRTYQELESLRDWRPAGHEPASGHAIASQHLEGGRT